MHPSIPRPMPLAGKRSISLTWNMLVLNIGINNLTAPVVAVCWQRGTGAQSETHEALDAVYLSSLDR